MNFGIKDENYESVNFSRTLYTVRKTTIFITFFASCTIKHS